MVLVLVSFILTPWVKTGEREIKVGVTSSVSGVFDVVIIVGALDAGFVPVAAVRELCRAAKPGNELVAVSMGPNRKQNGGQSYFLTFDLSQILQC